MTDNSYKFFSAEDFASDTYFQKWMLEDDHMTNIFWEKWLKDNPNKQEDVDLAKKIILRFRFKKYEASQEDFNEVWKNIKESQTERKTLNLKARSKKRYIGIAASILVLLTSLVLINDKTTEERYEDQVEITSPVIYNNIKAGTDKAILTLSDGSNVELTKGNIYNTENASSNGKEIIYNPTTINKETSYNYLTTPSGGQFFVELSDGTQVWLNSESRLKFPVNFPKGETREIELVYGEAYFDVSSSTENEGTKFKVINQAQEVEVLGTEFNIKAYKDESHLFTTLIEGQVAVNIMNKNKILVPEQQLKLDRLSNEATTYMVDVYREISWVKGVFSFKNKSLKEIMKTLSRWYEIEVVFNDQALENKIFSGTLKKKLGIEEVLETITAGNAIEYVIDNKTVTLK